MFKKCESCKQKKFWFQLKHREFKPNSFMPRIKSQIKMCKRCFQKLKANFNANRKTKESS